MICNACPRRCGADRAVSTGRCKTKEAFSVARIALHFWEEPPLSGTRGSGAVFFSGCNLNCVYCQNYVISSSGRGETYSDGRLLDKLFELEREGAHNINLVSPTHFVPQILSALDSVKPRLDIPIVYNTSGFERVETLQMLDGYIDIYLTDFKYKNSEISKKYSAAENYYEYAMPSLLEMYRQTGKYVITDEIIRRGIIIRHLVLPGHRGDSIEILRDIAQRISPHEVLLSLMSQYTPCHKAAEFPEINRRITTFEYKKVIEEADRLGFTGFMQERSSATLEMTPDFDLTGC